MIAYQDHGIIYCIKLKLLAQLFPLLYDPVQGIKHSVFLSRLQAAFTRGDREDKLAELNHNTDI